MTRSIVYAGGDGSGNCGCCDVKCEGIDDEDHEGDDAVSGGIVVMVMMMVVVHLL